MNELQTGQNISLPATSSGPAARGARALPNKDTGSQQSESTMSDILTSLVTLQRNAQFP